MLTAAVAGLPGVGKTMFWLRTGSGLGGRFLSVRWREPDGREGKRRMSPAEARCRLCSLGRHKTRNPQWMDIAVRRGLPWTKVRLTDTAGLVAGVHPDADLRRGMAESLRLLTDSPVWFHVVDLGRLARENGRLHEVDRELLRYRRHVPHYALIANKADLPGAAEAAERLIGAHPDLRIFVVSSLYRTGFDSVFRWLLEVCRRTA